MKRGKRAKWIGTGMLALGVIGLVASVPNMVKRLGDRKDLADRPMVWFGKQATSEPFTFEGERYSVTRVESEKGPVLRIGWREHAIDFPVNVIEDKPELPGLLKHEDWFKLVPMAIGPYRTQDEFQKALQAGEVKPRLIAAARYPAEGFDPGKWGSVRRREWRYRFVEFLHDAPHEGSIRVTETTYGELDRVFAPGPHDKPSETPLTDEQKYARLWEYYAMLQVTPPTMYRARDKLVADGMHAMGWTWPVAGGSVIIGAVGAVVLGASRVTPRR